MLTDIYGNLLQGLIPDSTINVPRPLPNQFLQKPHHSKLYNLCRWRNAVMNSATQKRRNPLLLLASL